MSFIVKPSNNEHDNYYPAEQEAKTLAYGSVVYEGVRGMTVKVWPLDVGRG